MLPVQKEGKIDKNITSQEYFKKAINKSITY